MVIPIIWSGMNIFKNISFISFVVVLLISCNNIDNEYDTAMVTFFNSSSYEVIVHRDSFYGPIIAEVNTIDRTTSKLIRINNENNITVFSIEYIIYPINDDFYNEYNNIFVSCYDPQIQIPIELKAGNSVTVQIPQPSNFIYKSAFLIIVNSDDFPIYLRFGGNYINQTNSILPITPNKQGLYKFTNIPDEGEYCQFYNIVSKFDNIYFSDFITENDLYVTKNGYVYSFVFNGISLKKDNERKIMFH